MKKSLSFLVSLSALFSAAASAQSHGADNLPEVNGEPINNVVAGAEVAAQNAQHYGNLESSSDVDHWTISVLSPARIVAWTSTRGRNPVDDTALDLLAADGSTVLATNDNEPGAAGNMSLVSYDITTPGVFYLAVYAGAMFSAPGDYALDILVGPVSGPTRFSSTTLITSTPACLGSSGFPITLVPRVGERPHGGSNCTLDVFDVPNPGPTVMLISFFPAVPIDICLVPPSPPNPPSGCDYALGGTVITCPLQPGGLPNDREFNLTIDPGWVGLGLTVHMQAVGIDTGLGASCIFPPIVISDRLDWRVGDELF